MAYDYLPDELVLNVPVIDKDHDKLYYFVEMFRSAIEDNDVPALGFIFLALTDYTSFHFDREERGLRVCGYENINTHVQEHQTLKESVFQIYEGLKKNPETFDIEKLYEIESFLKDWLNNHISVSDMAYKNAFASSPEAIKAMEEMQFSE